MTDEEKREWICSFTWINSDYEPYLIDGMIRHSGSCLIKSTLRECPAWSDGHIVMTFDKGDVYSGITECQAEWWHESYDSFDYLADSVLVSEAITPACFNDKYIGFSNGSLIQRAYYDLFWITGRNTGLRFEQDVEDVSSTILVYDDSGLIGLIAPAWIASSEQAAELIPLIIDYAKRRSEAGFSDHKPGEQQ